MHVVHSMFTGVCHHDDYHHCTPFQSLITLSQKDRTVAKPACAGQLTAHSDMVLVIVMISVCQCSEVILGSVVAVSTIGPREIWTAWSGSISTCQGCSGASSSMCACAD
eukprot:scpid72728/ scgid33846/ 